MVSKLSSSLPYLSPYIYINFQRVMTDETWGSKGLHIQMLFGTTEKERCWRKNSTHYEIVSAQEEGWQLIHSIMLPTGFSSEIDGRY